jgi:acylaminoacyl-peptidase
MWEDDRHPREQVSAYPVTRTQRDFCHNFQVADDSHSTRPSRTDGDAFMLSLIPCAGFRAGGDVLQGIDALVKDGIADPQQLAIGGYSFGGYLTNWLITQTSRFKAAVTGAGDVELVAGWGNNDDPFIFAHSLGGAPWEQESNYNAQVPIWQMDKVKTPTHIITGSEDYSVFFGEAYLPERALTTRGIPNRLPVFPGEGHELDRNPWHGKIKVREELEWIQRYGKSFSPTQ